MKNVRTGALVALFSGTAMTLGCSGGRAVNIGDSTTKGAQLSDYAASWVGYAQAYAFAPDGSDAIQLTIDANGQGTLRIGDGALLAPPTDPNVGYPPSASQNTATPPGDSTLVQGFLYPLHAADVQSARIQLGVDPNDIVAAWCALQTPVGFQVATGTGDGGTVLTTTVYNCLGNLEGSMTGPDGCTLIAADGTAQPIDCGKYQLCGFGACSCTATACTSTAISANTPVTDYPVEIDGALDDSGSTLTGTMVLAAGRVTVVLTKQ